METIFSLFALLAEIDKDTTSIMAEAAGPPPPGNNPGGNDPPRNGCTVMYFDGTTPAIYKFDSDMEARAWGLRMSEIKNEAVAIIGSYPNETPPAPGDLTTQQRQRIRAWLQMVDDARSTYGKVLPSVMKATQSFSDALEGGT